jgi:putative heme-binding domain-containing protein
MALGPDLAGITSRLSVTELFTAIIDPNREIAGPYRTTTFETRDGQVYTGMVVFESAEGYLVQTGPTTTVRLLETDIVGQRPGETSLMPTGLLNGLTAPNLADLYSFLRALNPRR